MTNTKYPGFFDITERADKLTRMGDPLVGLNERINWEAFRVDLNRVHEKERKSNAGAKPIDVVLMFKVLVLQQLHNLSDDRIEYQIRDRLSFMRFLGLQLEDRVPDAKTVWLFRERIKHAGLIDVLFTRFHEQLAAQGYVACAGQMIDATFVEVPRQRNSREENEQIKAGETPADWQQPKAKAKLRQKDVQARWTKKNNESHYGYKNHVNVDQANKLIQGFEVTDAAVHDSQMFDFVLDQTAQEDGNKRTVYADSAYRSQEREAQLAEAGIPSQICEKGARNCPLTEAQKASNTVKSKVRARVEHVFGAQAQMGGHIVRTIGFLRARIKIGMMNLVYNMVRLTQLHKRDRRDAPAAA
ncbi:MAG TPA: IS5 family transposase [Methylobacter sp.]|jgi:IS5 family transposase